MSLDPLDHETDAQAHADVAPDLELEVEAKLGEPTLMETWQGRWLRFPIIRNRKGHT